MENLFFEKRTASSLIEKSFGFVILCLDDLPSEVKLTCSKIKALFPQNPLRLVVPSKLTDQAPRFKECGVTVDVGGKTVTETINFGVSKSTKDWNFVLMAGANPTINLVKRFLYFCTDEKDLLYPVVNRRWTFNESSINGLLYNRKNLPKAPVADASLSDAKSWWGADILQNGGQLKAIVGNFS